MQWKVAVLVLVVSNFGVFAEHLDRVSRTKHIPTDNEDGLYNFFKYTPSSKPTDNTSLKQDILTSASKVVKRNASPKKNSATTSNINYGHQIGLVTGGDNSDSPFMLQSNGVQGGDNIFQTNSNVNYGNQFGIVFHNYQNEQIIEFLCTNNNTVFRTGLSDQNIPIFSSQNNINYGTQQKVVYSQSDGQEKDRLVYFWREYNGTVPSDAFPAGKDTNGRNTYIGQVYVGKNGFFIGEIIPTQKRVEVQSYGVVVVDSGIKVLCTADKRKLKWLPTKATTFHTDTRNKRLVIGGQNYKEPKCLNVGRVNYYGALRIGAIAPKEGNTYCYFAQNNKQEVAEDYEVLIYE